MTAEGAPGQAALPQVSLPGRAVVVTGAGRGIGAATAQLAARMGARVVVNDLDLAAAGDVAADIRRAGGEAVAHGADISSWTQAAQLVECCADSFGAIDGLVNNAAAYHVERVEELSEQACRQLVDVNVLGTLFCFAHAVKRMLAQGRGAVVNVVSGAQCGIEALSAYGATKGAAASLTYGWAVDLRGTPVRVNAMAPWAATRMAQVRQAYDARHGLPSSTAAADPEVNAPLACYLLADASAALHGQVVRLQGDKLSLMSHPAVLQPVLRRPAWSADAIADAFQNEFAGLLQPVGLNPAPSTP